MSEFTSCDDCTEREYDGECLHLDCVHMTKVDYFKPKPKQKIIDLSKLVGSDIDMEFGNSLNVNDLGFTTIDKLAEDNITKQGLYITKRQLKGFEQCRIRQDHWHSFKGDKCPLPDGLIIGYSSTDGARRWVNHCTHYEQLDWSLVYEFKVYGTADDACYEWEKEE